MTAVIEHAEYHLFEGHRVFFERAGEGASIVFLPNATLTGKLFEHQFAHFQQGYDTVVVDLPGFGRSDRIAEDLTLDLYVRWLECFVDDLSLAPVVLVGNCIGSLSALHFAARRPERVAALVLMNTLTEATNAAGANRAGTRIAQAPGMLRLAKAYMRHLPSRRQRSFPYPRSQFGPIGDARGKEYLEHTLRCFADPDTRVAQVSMVPDIPNWQMPEPALEPGRPPICWIWGETNKLLPLEAAKPQLNALKPDEVHIIPGCGYAAAWESPDEITEIIARFLKREGIAEHHFRELAFP